MSGEIDSKGIRLSWRGGGAWRPQGKLWEVHASWPLVQLRLQEQGGELITPWGPGIAFDWSEVQKVGRVKGLLPVDHGIQMLLQKDGESVRFNFAEEKGVRVDETNHWSWRL